jgi:hypothetical protein
MEWYEIVSLISSVIGVPGLIIFFFNRQEKKDAERAEYWSLQKKGTSAAISLGVEAAKCIQKGSHNGDLEDAKKYALSIKHEMDNFVTQQSSRNLT